MTSRKILGIDPGLANTGYGLLEKSGNRYTIITHGVLTTPSKDTLQNRLAKISRELLDLIDQHEPTEIAYESVFFQTNVSSAIQVANAIGAILLTAASRSVMATAYSPLQIKSAVTGYGGATKEQIQYMVQKICSIKTPIKPDHAADALAVAICHSHHKREF